MVNISACFLVNCCGCRNVSNRAIKRQTQNCVWLSIHPTPEQSSVCVCAYTVCVCCAFLPSSALLYFARWSHLGHCFIRGFELLCYFELTLHNVGQLFPLSPILEPSSPRCPPQPNSHTSRQANITPAADNSQRHLCNLRRNSLFLGAV